MLSRRRTAAALQKPVPPPGETKATCESFTLSHFLGPPTGVSSSDWWTQNSSPGVTECSSFVPVPGGPHCIFWLSYLRIKALCSRP